MSQPLNPKTTEREFGGSPGALGITFGLPALTVVLHFMVNGVKLAELPEALRSANWSDIVLNSNVWKAYLAWFFGLVVLDLIVPGKIVKGTTLRDGSALNYKINGFNLIFVLAGFMGARLYLNGGYLEELEFVYNYILHLAVVSIIFSFLVAVFVYGYSFVPLQQPNLAGTKDKILSVNGNTESWFFNWFIGRELNPRIWGFDVKLFCELKPGLLLWYIINLSCCHHQYWTDGKVSNSLILVTALQGIYSFDGVLNEQGVLSMMDIATDGFGFMLSFGDLSLVPFTYTLQARYLTLYPLDLSYLSIISICAVNVLGYYIMYLSNQQKSNWKRGLLQNKGYKYIQTKTGSKLLCDSWWGYSQHINYFGDWLISWAWCLTTGFSTPLTYYYVFYFGGLLVHRQGRDEIKCSEKYGKQWEEYSKEVPYKIIPYVY